MSYNGSGTFTINTTGQPVVAGTVISASAFNSLTNDLATGLTTAITKDGQTTTTARITFAQGITSSLVTDSSSVSTGSIITAGGVGIAKSLNVGSTTDSSSISTGSIVTAGGVGVAKNLYVGGALNVTGVTSFTNPVINNIKMGYSTTATAAGTTTLTISSNYRQFFTGTLAQTIVLPVTSTLVTGIAYEIENNSTGLLTVNSSGGNLVGTIPAGVCAHAVCIGTTLTTAADWDWDYISTTTITGTGANVLGTSPTITTPTISSLSSAAATALTLQSAGTTAITVDTSQNVGIGTASPANKLHVSDTTTSTVKTRTQASTGYVDVGMGGNSGVFDTTGSDGIRLRTSGNDQVSIDTAGVFKFNSGYGSVATAYGCRAWVNFNGTGTVAIRGSGNVSSITDNGVGSYTMNFTTSMPDTNYCATGVVGIVPGVSEAIILPNFTPPGTETASATGSFKFATIRPSVTVAGDANYVYLTIFR